MIEQEQSATAETWEQARNVAALVGYVASYFKTAARVLVAEEKGAAEVSPVARSNVTRLFHGPVMKASLYYASMTYKRERLSEARFFSTNDLVRLYRPGELASLVSLVILWNKTKRFIPEPHGSMIGKRMQAEVDAGYFVGRAIPKIGPSAGMIVPSIRWIAFALFWKLDHKGAGSYYRKMNKERPEFDPAAEIDWWGCSVSQVSSILLQYIGFGVETASLAEQTLASAGDPARLEGCGEKLYRYKALQVWVEALLATGAEPVMSHKVDYYPMKEELALLMSELAEIVQGGSRYHWLNRTAEDITPEATPELFIETECEAKEGAAEPVFEE